MIDETKIGTPPVDPCAYGHGEPIFHEPSGRYVCTSPKCPNSHAGMIRADWTWTQRRITSRRFKDFQAGFFACHNVLMDELRQLDVDLVAPAKDDPNVNRLFAQWDQLSIKAEKEPK